jgi:predicted site-specific integrase-resolvase
MRLQEAAKFLGVSLKTATREKDAGKLEAFKLRGRWFTTMAFVHAYIDQQIQKAKGRKKPC